jgi:CNT family concentrative nucleoside transporter
VIYLGQSEAPLLIQSHIPRLTRSELFAVTSPASLYTAKLIFPETEESQTQKGVRDVRDEQSENAIDATARGAQRRADRGDRGLPADRLHLPDRTCHRAAQRGGRVVRLRRPHLQKVLGWVFSPVAWLIGVP